MTQEVETVTVDIGDRPYTLKAGDDPEYIRKVAQYVDQRMKQLAKMAPSLQPTHLAVLTAINITDELFQNRPAASEDWKEAERRIQALIDLLPS